MTSPFADGSSISAAERGPAIFAHASSPYDHGHDPQAEGHMVKTSDFADSLSFLVTADEFMLTEILHVLAASMIASMN